MPPPTWEICFRFSPTLSLPRPGSRTSFLLATSSPLFFQPALFTLPGRVSCHPFRDPISLSPPFASRTSLPIAYASLYLSTLPHTSLDAGTWVYSWVISKLASTYHSEGSKLIYKRSSYYLVYPSTSSVPKSVRELYCSYTSCFSNWFIMFSIVIW
jgi:hypothetical protein